MLTGLNRFCLHHPSPIVQDMQRTAMDLGVTAKLLDVLVANASRDTSVVAELVGDVLQLLGIQEDTQARHVCISTNGAHGGIVTGSDPHD